MVLDHDIWTVVAYLVVELAAGLGMAISAFEIALVAEADLDVFGGDVEACAKPLDLIQPILPIYACAAYVPVTHIFWAKIFDVPAILATTGPFAVQHLLPFGYLLPGVVQCGWIGYDAAGVYLVRGRMIAAVRLSGG